ncbi:MAG TPA: ATP-binding protein [Blastocatellia bacterium]|nr:ATP-binding protein [Blastocatellia bacterium]
MSYNHRGMLLILIMVSFAITVALGFYVLISAPNRPTNRVFAFFIGLLLLWMVKDLAFWGFHGANEDARWWVAASFVSAVVLHLPLICFAWSFPEDEPLRWRRGAWAVAPLAILLPLLILTNTGRAAGFTNGVFHLDVLPIDFVLSTCIFLLNGYAVSVLIKKYRRYRGRLWGHQLAFVIGAVVTTAVLTSTAAGLLPLFGRYELLPYTSVMILCGLLFYAYAITNFKLFSVQSALDQLRLFPLTYKVALTVTGVGLLGFLVLQVPVVWWSFGSGDAVEWKRYVAFSVICGTAPCLLLIFLIVRALSRPLRTITEAAVEVSEGRYGAEVDLVSNDEIGVLAGAFNQMSRKLEADIAHMNQMTEGLIRSEKLATAGVLAAGVAHEVNNPLASISSLTQMLLRGETDPARQETLNVILTQIHRISQIVRDLTEFARPKEPVRSLVGLNQIIEHSLRLISVDKQFKQLALRTNLDPRVPDLQLDRDQMQQVFLNLFLNARDAMADGGELSVETRYDAGNRIITVEVSDTGGGISDENRDRIFDPFFTTKPAGKGTGLGLSICYGIIRAHAGEIRAVADERTRFIITLPADAADFGTSQ